MSVCMSAIDVHISEPICTKVGVGGLWHVKKVMSRLVLQLDHQEACGRLWNPENRNPPICHVSSISGFTHRFLGSFWTDFNQHWCVDRYTMKKYKYKKSDQSRRPAPSLMSVCVSAIDIHISELICTRFGEGGLWRVGKVMSRLVLQPDHQQTCGRL